MLTSSMRRKRRPATRPGSNHRGAHHDRVADRPRREPPPARNPGDEMLSLQEACAFLRVPEGTLRYWRHLGSGPRSFKIGRPVRYWRADLVLWLTEQTHRPMTDR